MMCSTSIKAQYTTTWQIGYPNATDLTATYSTNTNTLTISGAGAMQDFNWSSSNNQPPWSNISFYSIVIEQGVTHIGDCAFFTQNHIGTITIPNSVTSIGWAAFQGCDNLKSVNIPNSVTLIGPNAFYACNFLPSITIPSSVIGSSAFAYCSRLTSVIILNSVTSIGNYAFQSCTSLPSVTIPNSVTSIGDYTFSLCSGLTSITCLNSSPSNIALGNEVFLGVDKTSCVLNVPASSVSAYQVAPQWQDFMHIVGNDTGISSIEIPDLKFFPNPVKDELSIIAENQINKVEIYTLDGKIQMQENNFTGKINVSTLTKGVYLVKVYIMQGVETVKIIKN